VLTFLDAHRRQRSSHLRPRTLGLPPRNSRSRENIESFSFGRNYNSSFQVFMKAISAVLLILTVATTAPAQIEEAHQAMERSDNVGAVRILSDALANNPTAEVYLTLGTVYDRMKDFRREEDILKEGAQRYPQDPRFHNQLADLALENNDREAAKIELHRALDRDPNNSYASD